MALAVWMLYAADRLLDARLLDAERSNDGYEKLEARHLFHHRYRKAFLVAIALAGIALAVLLSRLGSVAVHLYLVEGALLAVWFVILHATRNAHRLPKEIAVGLFFSAAVFIPTIAREPTLRSALLPCAILFAALCSLNCLFIYAWEHDRPTIEKQAHATTRLAVTHLPVLDIVLACASATVVVAGRAPRPIPAACALSALLLLALHRNHPRIERTNLRAAADLALLTPLLLLPFLR